MLKYFRWIIPCNIAGQIATLVVGSVLVHLAILTVVAAIFFSTNEDSLPVMRHPVVAQAVAITRMIDATPDPQGRANLIKSILVASPNFHLENYAEVMSIIPQKPNEVNTVTGWVNIQTPKFQSELKRNIYIGVRTEGDGNDKVLVALDNGFAMSFRVPTDIPSDIPSSLFWLGILGSSAIVLMMISVWAANRLGSPLSRLATAASKFDADRPFVPMAEKGPSEVIEVSRAFNEMGKRTSQLVEDRTYLIAAVSHDLRTPITRLRLRSEDIKDPDLKKQILGDLGSMERLVQSSLSYLKSRKQAAQFKPTDLSSLLQSISDDFTDFNQPVHFVPHARLAIQCDQDQIARAVNNIIENALNVDAKVVLSLKKADNAMIDIVVQDDGPGIPNSRKSAMLKPFQRGDDARGAAEGDGFGLGLSICTAIAQSHGGKMILEDASPHGLIVTLRLPIIQ
jgi:signal transduction histidine kinase